MHRGALRKYSERFSYLIASLVVKRLLFILKQKQEKWTIRWVPWVHQNCLLWEGEGWKGK